MTVRTLTIIPLLVIVALAGVTVLAGEVAADGTCFANAQFQSVRAHVLCTDPEANPCLAKAKVGDTWVRLCDV